MKQLKYAFLTAICLFWASGSYAAFKVTKSDSSAEFNVCLLSVYGRMDLAPVSMDEPLMPNFSSEKWLESDRECIQKLKEGFNNYETSDKGDLEHNVIMLDLLSATWERNPEGLRAAVKKLLSLVKEGLSPAEYLVWALVKKGEVKLTDISIYLDQQTMGELLAMADALDKDSNNQTIRLHKEFEELENSSKARVDFSKKVISSGGLDGFVDEAKLAYLCASDVLIYKDKEVLRNSKEVCGSLNNELFVPLRMNEPVTFSDSGRSLSKALDLFLSYLEATVKKGGKDYLSLGLSDVTLKTHYLFTQIANYYLRNPTGESEKWFTKEKTNRIFNLYKKISNAGFLKENEPLERLYIGLAPAFTAYQSVDVSGRKYVGLSPALVKEEKQLSEDYAGLSQATDCSLIQEVGSQKNQIPKDWIIKFLTFDDYTLGIDSLVQRNFDLILQGRVTEIYPSQISGNYKHCLFDVFDDQNNYAYPVRYLDDSIQDIRLSHSRSRPKLNGSTLELGSGGQVIWHFIYDVKIDSDFDFSNFPSTIPPTWIEANLFTESMRHFRLLATNSFDNEIGQGFIDNQTTAGIGKHSSIEVYPGRGGQAHLKLLVEPQQIFYLAKVIIPCFGFIAMGLLTLLRPLKDSEANLQVATTAVLSAVAYQFVINDSLPALSYLTIVDIFLLLMFMSLTFAVFFNLVPHVCITSDGEASEKLLAITRLISFGAAGSAAIVFLYGVYLTYSSYQPHQLLWYLPPF